MSAIIGFIVAGIGTLIAYMLIVPPLTGTGTMGWGLGGWIIAFIAAVIGLFVGMIGGAIGRVISKTSPVGIGESNSGDSKALGYGPGIGAILGGLPTVQVFVLKLPKPFPLE